MWECTEKAITEITANLERYAQDNYLYLNKDKTQVLRIGHKDTLTSETLNVLGVELNCTCGFSHYHATMLKDLRQRAGAVRQVATMMTRGKLLGEIARSLVENCNAMHGSQEKPVFIKSRLMLMT